tara:strand:- start:214 stop:537 length:324 start_codon:yes stop_codon:yes gene_type:complete
MTQTIDSSPAVTQIRTKLLYAETLNRSIMQAGAQSTRFEEDAQKAFDRLTEETGDCPFSTHPLYNEYWQYMGSVMTGCGRRYVQFRHRQHPLFDRRVYVAFPIKEIN